MREALARKLLAFWTFYKAHAGAARMGLSVRDLLAWVTLSSTCCQTSALYSFPCSISSLLLTQPVVMSFCLMLRLLSVCLLHLLSNHCSATSCLAAFCSLLLGQPVLINLCLTRGCRWLQVRFINSAAPHIGVEAAYSHGAHLVLLDGIGLGVGMPPQVSATPFGGV